MTRTIAVDEVVAVLAPMVRGGKRIAADTPLLSTGLIDSFAMAELLARLEERFGVALDLDDLGVDVADTAAMITCILAAHP
jgi:acyl carrier protein